MTAFGVNAIALPPGYETGRHFHDEQEELYFLHRGTIEIEFGDGAAHIARAGRRGPSRPRDRARRSATSAPTTRSTSIVGAKDGYVGRDGRLPEGETNRRSLGDRRASGRR